MGKVVTPEVVAEAALSEPAEARKKCSGKIRVLFRFGGSPDVQWRLTIRDGNVIEEKLVTNSDDEAVWTPTDADANHYHARVLARGMMQIKDPPHEIDLGVLD